MSDALERMVQRALAVVERRLEQLTGDNIQIRDNQQAIRARIIALEAEVRELRAYIRRSDRNV